MRLPRPLRAAALLLPLTLTAAAGGHPWQPGLAPCLVEGVAGEARCGTISVPENPAAPAGRRLALRVVVLRARSPGREPEAVFYLTGGPGQAATAGAARVADELAEVRERRDLVLVDQRGTGAGGLQCRLGRPSETVRAWVTGAFPLERLQACRRSWSADPRFYTTRNTVEDLERVRAALGYPRVDLVGVSYGTRPALAYLRRFPNRVRTVTLRGVYPSSAPLPLYVARDAQAALDRLAATDPALPGDLAHALARADSAPARLPVKAGDGVVDTLLADREVLAGSLLLALYSRSGAAQVPAAVHAAARGEPEALVSVGAGGMLPLLETLSTGVYLSVVCSEDLVQIPRGEGDRAAAGTVLGGVLVRNLERSCAGWPLGLPPDDYTAPVRSDAPVLVISGDADPVTPPRWGASVVATLAHGAHLVLRGEGHVPSFPPCARHATAALIATGSVAGLDLACAGEGGVAAAMADTIVPADTTGPPADVAGRWTMIWRTRSGPREAGWLVLRQSGDRVEAELHGQGSLNAEGTVHGSLLVLSGHRMLVPFELRAAARGDTLAGVLRVLAVRRAFTAVRQRSRSPG